MAAIHHAAAEGFAADAESYVRGRPDYPPEIEAWLRDDLGLREGKAALDLGAGTGKFLPRLRATGARVVAVEPVAAMLTQLHISQPDIEAREGTAEQIPLADGAVDAVTCAQAFHWFATAAAVAEIRRVLRPGGVLGLIWNVRDESIAWVAALSRLMSPYEGDVPRYHRQEWRRVFPAPGFGPLREQHFHNLHRGSPERVILDRILSVSFIAALPTTARDKVAADIRALIAATPELAGRAEVAFPYDTAAFSCVKFPSPALRSGRGEGPIAKQWEG
jgi:SAM-dependent methyltransferase